jgi:hypothetical protein
MSTSSAELPAFGLVASLQLMDGTSSEKAGMQHLSKAMCGLLGTWQFLDTDAKRVSSPSNERALLATD